MREQHIVPLSRQAISALGELHQYTGQGKYLFPGQNNSEKFMSENTMIYAIYRMGYHSRATGHGFRATASTILNEEGFSPDAIERQLAHTERNKVRAVYNHAQYLRAAIDQYDAEMAWEEAESKARNDVLNLWLAHEYVLIGHDGPPTMEFKRDNYMRGMQELQKYRAW